MQFSSKLRKGTHVGPLNARTRTTRHIHQQLRNRLNPNTNLNFYS